MEHYTVHVPCSEGLNVGDSFGELPNTHQCPGLLDAVEDLLLLRNLLVQL